MILRPFALTGFTLAAVLLALNLMGGGAVLVFAAAALCILVLCVALKPLKRRGVYAVAMLSVMLACAWFTAYETYVYTPNTLLAGSGVSVRAQLITNPIYSDGVWNSTLKVLSIDGKAAECKMNLRSEDYFEAEPYDTLNFTADVISIEDVDKSIQNYYKSKRIFLISYGFTDLAVEPCAEKPVGYYLLKANSFLKSELNNALDGDAAALAVGMLTGDKTGINRLTQKQFSKTGLSHVLAVSGLHMSILVLSLYKLLRLWFRRFRRVTAVGCILAAVLYAGVTGFSPSALRSCIMLCVMLGSKLVNRRADALNSMGLAAFAIVLSNPYSVADWSFMLSFSATLGIVLLNRRINSFSSAVCKKIRQPQLFGLAVGLLDSVGISVAATLFCLPVSVFFVGSVSTVFIPANLLTLYAVPAVLVTALITAVLPGAVSAISAFLCEAFCAYILKVVKLLSLFEYARISTDSALVKFSLAAAGLVILAAVLFMKNRGKLLRLSAAVVAATVAVNIAFGAAMEYKQVSIAANEDCIVVYKGSTAAVFAFGYYGCYGADSLLDDLAIDNVTLVLPLLKTDGSVYKIDEFFENYNVQRLVLAEDHECKRYAENYEITNNCRFEFGGIETEFFGSCCMVTSPSGSTLIAFTPEIPRIEADFLAAYGALPEAAIAQNYTASLFCGSKNYAFYGENSDSYDTYVSLKYNGFGRYEIKGG